MNVKVEVLDPFEDFSRTAQNWTVLSSNAKTPYFLSWGWIENWLTSLKNDIKVRLIVLTEQSVPVAMFFAGEAKVVRKKVFTSNGVFLNTTGLPEYDSLCIEYNSILCSESFRYSFVRVLESLPQKWDEFFMPALDVNSFPGKCIQSSFDPYQIIIEKERQSPYVDLQIVRNSEKGYISLLGKNTSYNIRRSYRIYEEKGTVAIEIADNLNRAFAIYDELICLHQKTWKARGLPGAFASDYFRNFHKELIRKRFCKREIQLIRVTVGKETIGCLYNFVFKEKVFFYQSGINYSENKKLKPGLVCHFEAINYNAGLSNSVYDFLGGTDEYKTNLSTNANRLIWARVQKKLIKFKIENKLRYLKRSFKESNSIKNVSVSNN